MSVKYVQLFFGVGIKRVNLKALNMYITLISDPLVGSLITGWTWWKWQNWRMKSTTEICTMETISTRPDMTVPAPLWIGITRSGSLPKTNYYYETYLQDIFSWYFHDLYILLDWSKKLSKYSMLSIDDINKYFEDLRVSHMYLCLLKVKKKLLWIPACYFPMQFNEIC